MGRKLLYKIEDGMDNLTSTYQRRNPLINKIRTSCVRHKFDLGNERHNLHLKTDIELQDILDQMEIIKLTERIQALKNTRRNLILHPHIRELEFLEGGII